MVSKTKKLPYNIPSIDDLFRAGVHLGHSSRRWHPATAPYIFKKVGGFHIIDLEKVRDKLAEACKFLYEIACEGEPILFVGLKKQSEVLIEEEAKRVGVMFITGRWIGGIFTNFSEVAKNISKLKKLEKGLAGGEFAHYTKKERLGIEREIARLERMFGGVRELEGLPQVLFLASARRAQTAVREARRVGVPVVAVIDSNTDPRVVDYPIPGNDDSLKSLSILVRTVADAVGAGYRKGKKGGKGVKGEGGLEGLDISARTKNALEKAGMKTLPELRKLGKEELLGIKGIGEKAVREIEEFLISNS